MNMSDMSLTFIKEYCEGFVVASLFSLDENASLQKVKLNGNHTPQFSTDISAWRKVL